MLAPLRGDAACGEVGEADHRASLGFLRQREAAGSPRVVWELRNHAPPKVSRDEEKGNYKSCCSALSPA